MMRGNTAPSGKTPAERLRNPVRLGTPFFPRLSVVEVAYGIAAACRGSINESQACQSDEGSSPTPSPRPRGRPSLATGCAARQIAGRHSCRHNYDQATAGRLI